MKLTLDNISRIIERYNKGESSTELAKEFKVNSKTIRYHINKRGKGTRKDHHQNRWNKEKRFDPELFKRVDEGFYYWSGFLMGDGSVYKDRIKIKLKASDEEHLEKWRKYAKIKTNTSLEKTDIGNKVHTCCVVSFNSKKVRERLENLGVTSNKSYTAKANDTLAKNRHFWRGMVDSDGCLWVHRGRLAINFSSKSEDLINQYKDWLLESLEINKKVSKNSQGMYTIVCYSMDAQRVGEKLYGYSEIYLSRKKNVFKENRSKL